jgi:hypothetical protein
LFVLAVYWLFKTFCHLVCFFICGHSTYLLSAFVVYVVHTSSNRYEFYLRSLRFSVLNIPYCFSVSNLAESKLFVLPKLSNVPTKCLLFLPLVSRCVHQQHYCISYLYHERYRYNIPFSTINITRSIQFYHQYYERHTNYISLSTNNITRGTETILLILLKILRGTHILLLFLLAVS